MIIIINFLKTIGPFIISFICLYVVLSSTINKIKILNSFNRCDDMPGLCGSLGYVINLSGKKGIGKTTTAAGIVNNLIIYLQNIMLSRMENTRKSLNFIDFNELENKYLYNYKKFENDHNLALNEIIKRYTFNTFYTDNLSLYNKRDMLNEYLEYFYILNIRQYYTLSKTYFFDCVSFQNSKNLDSSSLELRHVEERRNYQLHIGQVIFDDEKSLDSGNVFSNSKDIKLSGKKEHRALLRNAYKGLCYEVTTKQYDEDEVKLERKQIDASINIRSRKIIDYKFPLLIFLRFVYNFLFFFIKLKYFFNYNKIIAFKKSKGKLRNFETFLDNVEKIISSKGFIKVYGRLYYDPDDVGKQDKSLYEKICFVFPKIYCYASINTYEWSAIRKYYEQFDENCLETISSLLDEKSKVELWKKALERGIRK